MINNLRYADDTTLINGNLDDLKILINTVKETREKANLEIKYKENKSDDNSWTSGIQTERLSHRNCT